MLRTIHLHGHLGTKFGKQHRLDVASPAEAVRALAAIKPGFRTYFAKKKWVITAGRVPMSNSTLPMKLGAQQDIHIVPSGMASGLETILLVGSLVLSVASAALMLFMPKANAASNREDSTKTASFMFDGGVNSTEQGHPIQLVYGKMRVGTLVGSAGIVTTDYVDDGTTDTTTDTNVYEDGLAGGGKGQSGSTVSATEVPNSLRSTSTARVLDIVGEGEMVGLVDGLKSIYFDNTVLRNADGTDNFSGVTMYQRTGTADQDFIPGFSQTEDTRDISTKVSRSVGPVTRAITNADATVARVSIRLPSLYAQDTSNGNIGESTVAVRIYTQADGGGFTTATDMVFSGKTNSGYERSVEIRLPAGTTRQIRVERLTDDSTVSSLLNETDWSTLTEVVEAKLSYPHTACIGLVVDAKQFGTSIPSRSYEVKGLIVEVPSNYDPVTRAYSGLWDGTFKRAWTDNPAWCTRDLILNRRYGLGARILPQAVDKWAMYTIAQRCDELIPDGFGGQRPRFTMNCCITEEAQAYDVVASMASNFRGLTYWGSGAISFSQDAPEDPSVLVTPANVSGGDFAYSRLTPYDQRRSVAVVWWNDPEQGYKLTPEIYEDPDLVRKFGRRTGDELTAFGIDNKGQAHNACRWMLEDEAATSNSQLNYASGADHAFATPGRIAEVADPMYTAGRRGGRVADATANSITLDAAFTFQAGHPYFLRVVLPDGSVSRRTITNGVGPASVINLSGTAFPIIPNKGAIWTIESSTVVNRQWRIRSLAIDERPWAVTAVLHDPTKYARIEQDTDITTPNYLELPSGPLGSPGDFHVTEFLKQSGTASIPYALMSWSASSDPRVITYQAQFQPPGEDWQSAPDSSDLSREIIITDQGDWSFRVRALDSLGRRSPWVTNTYTLTAQVDSVPNVSGLTVHTDNQALITKLTWTPVQDPRPLRTHVWYNAGPDFTAAAKVATVSAAEYTVSQIGFYWVQNEFLGTFSVNPPSAYVGADQMPSPNYDQISNVPQNLQDLDPQAAQKIADMQTDIADLFTTYGSTASAAESALAAATSATSSANYAGDAATSAQTAEGYASAANASEASAAAQALLAASYYSTTPNLLKNGSFENGLDDWNGFGNVVVPTGYGYGPRAEYNNTPLNTSGSDFQAAVSSLMPIQGGATYTASADLMIFADNPNAYAYVDVIYYKADQTTVTLDGVQHPLYANADYSSDITKRRATAATDPAPADAAFALVRWIVNSGTGSITSVGIRQAKFERNAQATAYTVEGGLQSSNANIKNEQSVRASADAALATQISQISTSVIVRSNLLGNPSAADGINDWTVWHGDITPQPGTAGDGPFFYANGLNQDTRPSMYQNIPYDSTAAVSIQAEIYTGSMVRNTSTDAVALVYCMFLDAGGSQIGATNSASVPPGFDWTLAKSENNIPPTGTKFLRVYVETLGNGTYTVNGLAWRRIKVERGPSCTAYSDDKAITSLSASITTTESTIATLQSQAASFEQRLTAGSPNLVKNGSAEMGMAYWTGRNGAWGSETGVWGSIFISRTASPDFAYFDSDPIPVFENAPYSCAVDAEVGQSSGSDRIARIELLWYSNPNGVDGFLRQDYGTSVSMPWFGNSLYVRQAIAVHQTSPAGAQCCRVRLVGFASNFAYAAFKGCKFEYGSVCTSYTQEATVLTQAGVINTIDGKTQAYLQQVVSAGSSRTALRMYADGSTSGIELQANAIRLGDANLPALDVVGGNVYFYGKLTAASVTQSMLSLGGRNIYAQDFNFRISQDLSQIVWDNGVIFWTDDNGNPALTSVNGGSVAWPGTYVHVFWTKAAGNFSTSIGDWSQAIVQDGVEMATWQGGASLTVNYGSTIINGDRITTGSISAQKLNVTSLSAITGTIGLLRTATSGARMELESNQQRVYDSNGTLRILLGVW